VNIAHFGPFASPVRKFSCGLYHSMRDMVIAERRMGHNADVVDIGIQGKRVKGPAYADTRGEDADIVPVDYDDVRDFDLFVTHSDLPKTFIAQTKAPIIHVLHGRPLASFRLHQKDPKKAPVLDLLAGFNKEPRYKKFLSLWPEHVPYWEVLIPPEKLASTPHPPVDTDLWLPLGPIHPFLPDDGFHVLVADIWRSDSDPYWTAQALLRCAGRIPNLKVHFYGCNTNLGPWRHIFDAMKRAGIMGELYGMMSDIAPVYRGADLVVTHHDIATRIVREALSCGTPIVAGSGSRYTPFKAHPETTEAFAYAICRGIDYVRSATEEGRGHKERRLAIDKFGLDNFGRDLMPIYEQVLEKEVAHAASQ